MTSFITVPTDAPFSLENLPYGVFRPRTGGPSRVGVAIGPFVLDLALLEQHHLLHVPGAEHQPVFARSSLNAFMALGRNAWRETRATLHHLLKADVTTLRDNWKLRHEALIPQEDVELLLPIEIGDYTDFYSSRDHAANVGRLVRGADHALPPNWLHMPIAYHGRASSVIVGGVDIRRPIGQRLPERSTQPVFGPTRALDFELEVGFVIGTGNAWGHPIPVDRAWEHVFGVVLVNDWSARDIQKWEYQPLGPFLSKNFATSISPWVVPLEALEPFRIRGVVQEPQPLPYLHSRDNPTFDVHLEVWLQTPHAKQPERLCTTHLRHVYWNIAQQIAHHTITGCNLRTGDLLATGTVSGPEPESRACLLEQTRGGQEPLQLSGGETRRFLEDGDRLTITGWCQAPDHRVGWGELTAKVLPAHLADALSGEKM